jgi:plasmid stabilization system protein ParE
VKRRILKRPRAKRDLIAHFAYLAEHASLEEARRFLRTIDAALEQLLAMPEMGARWDSPLPQCVFRAKSDTDSGACRTPIPIDLGH